MIDCHCHILWGVDDASKNREQSLDMLRIACADGLEGIVATSHIKPPLFYNDKNSLLAAKFELDKMIKDNELPISIYIGGENYIGNNTLHKLYNDEFITYNDKGKYMLIEFAWTYNTIDDPTYYISEVLKCGYIPVIAHPERYEWVYREYRLVRLWKEMGAMMQLNRTSILGYDKIAFAQVLAEKILDDDMADIIASDAHRCFAPRYPKLSDCYRYVEKRWGKEKAELYFNINPKKLIK